MLRFSALVPDATINYIKNPSMRYDATDWNSAGSTLTRSLEQARFGIASLKVVTAGTGLQQGAFYRVSALQGVSEPITVSVYVRGEGRVRIRLINNPTGMEWASQSIQLEGGFWQRISVSGFSTGSNDMRLYVETQEQVTTARTFYVDGAQMERHPYPTTFCDGDQPGCRWNGIYHASTSQRSAYTRAGGRWVQLAGDEREAQDLYMTVVNGLGAAAIVNNVQPFALAPGGYFQNSKIASRAISLTFHAKHKVDPGSAGAGNRSDPVSLAALHQLRQLLIDVVKPDRTGGDEDIWFEYDDGNTPLYFQARYNGGLEGQWDVRNQFVNSFPLNLLAVSPTIKEDSQEATVLDFQEVIRPNRVVGRIDGQWNILNYGVSDTVYALARGRKGEIYALGAFATANNNALAVDPLRPVNGVAYWDGEKWNPMGSGMNVPAEGAIAVAPNGDVYVTGNFTTIGGVAANRIAKWNGSAWSALGTGLNGAGRALAIAPNGDVYAGGTFTTAGGVTVNYIARWDGLQWRRLGQFGGLDNFVLSIDMTPDGLTLYVGGDFSFESSGSGTDLNFVASYNTITGLFSAMGDGFNTTVHAVRLAKSGIVYAGGQFVSSADTLTSLLRVAQWNGSAWTPLGSGVNERVRGIETFENGDVLLTGWFTTAGGKPAKNMALWNGSTFFNLDAQIDSTTTQMLYKGLALPNGDIYVGGATFVGTGNMKVSGFTTVTNVGSTEVHPLIYVLGPGTLRWIENQTTGKRMYFNLAVLNGEEVFLDFARGDIYSTVRGSLLYALLPGSDFRAFTLLPGDNRIACFMVDDVSAQMQISFIPQHWSVDATQHGESL